MKNQKIKDILLYIFTGIFILFFLIYGIVTKTSRLIVASCLLVGIPLVVFIIRYIFVNKLIRGLNKLEKYYNELTQKQNKTLFEEIYVSIVDGTLEKEFSRQLHSSKVQNVTAIDFYIVDKDEVALSFKYFKFDIFIYIKEDKITYEIDSPSKYDNTLNNKELEELRTTDIKLNDYIDLELFFDALSILIEEIQNEVNEFKEENIVDDFFNGRLLNKLEQSSSYLKQEGYICAILGPIVSIILCFVGYACITDIDYYNENPFGYVIAVICLLGFTGLFVGATIYGFNYIYKYKAMLSDIKNKRATIINEKPKRVRIIRDQPTKYSNRRTLRYIKLYFSDVSLLIPYKNYECIQKPHNIRKACQECMEIKSELKYLTKSRIVVSGGEKYIKVTKRHLM